MAREGDDGNNNWAKTKSLVPIFYHINTERQCIYWRLEAIISVLEVDRYWHCTTKCLVHVVCHAMCHWCHCHALYGYLGSSVVACDEDAEG